jgi:hypothetical protein
MLYILKPSIGTEKEKIKTLTISVGNHAPSAAPLQAIKTKSKIQTIPPKTSIAHINNDCPEVL